MTSIMTAVPQPIAVIIIAVFCIIAMIFGTAYRSWLKDCGRRDGWAEEAQIKYQDTASWIVGIGTGITIGMSPHIIEVIIFIFLHIFTGRSAL